MTGKFFASETSFLSNGALLVTACLPEREAAAVGVFFGVGSRHEKEGEEGVAHFLEHILFKGSTTRSAAQIVGEIEGVGGSVNAYTSEELTCYEARGPAFHLKKMTEVLVDMVSAPLFSPEEIEKEREVILEELVSYEETPSEYVQELAAASVWGSHPLGKAVIGTRASIATLGEEKLRAFHQRYFQGRPLLSVVSSFSHEEVKSWVEESFGRLPLTLAGEEPVWWDYSCVQPAYALKEDLREVEQTNLVLSFIVPGRRSEQRYALRLLSVLWGETMSSRLFQLIREKHALAYSIYTDYTSFEEVGSFSINLGVDIQNEEKALALIVAEKERLRQEGVSAEELEQAKNYLWGQFIVGLDSVGAQMNWLGESLLLEKKVRTPLEIKAEIDKVSLEQVKGAIECLFLSGEGALARVGEAKKGS